MIAGRKSLLRKARGMNAGGERQPIGLSTEAFLEKWMPQALTPKAKSDFLMDLERLVLARALENDADNPPPTSAPDDFDWDEDDGVAVRRVHAVAVYKSAEGDIVIRQEHPAGEEDTILVIPLRSAHSVVDAIQRQLKDCVYPAAVSTRPE